MQSRAVTFAVIGALIVLAAVLVVGTVRGQHAPPVEPEADAVPSREAVTEAEQVVCAVCAGKHPRDEMFVVAVESLGYAPDSLPVLVCSEVCKETALGDPEKHRKATISELEKSAAQ